MDLDWTWVGIGIDGESTDKEGKARQGVRRITQSQTFSTDNGTDGQWKERSCGDAVYRRWNMHLELEEQHFVAIEWRFETMAGAWHGHGLESFFPFSLHIILLTYSHSHTSSYLLTYRFLTNSLMIMIHGSLACHGLRYFSSLNIWN